MKHGLRPLIVMAAILSFVGILGNADASPVTGFAPTQTITIEDNTPEQPSGYTLDFNVPDGDVNFAGVVFFIPKEWGVVKGSAIPVGASVGKLEAQATLGLLNGTCNSILPVDFEMMNGSLDASDTVAFEDADDNSTADFAEDKDGNDVPDAVDKYPDFLTRVFKDSEPIRRSAGVTIVAGQAVLLQFLVFPPGTDVGGDRVDLPNDPALGYPSVTVLQNIGDIDTVPAPGIISDFCSPLSAINTTLGSTPEGQPLFVNPQPGKYDFTTIAVGQRDADGDGLENSMDTCPFVKNSGDPRIPNVGDLDTDGLDAACDTNDDPEASGTNSDEDLDGYMNRNDNCPMVPNGELDASNQRDEDLDQIGDVCDTNKDVADGDQPQLQLVETVTIGDGGTGEPGGPPSSCADCYKLGDETNGTAPGSDSGGGSSTIIIIIGIIAAVAVVGGGGFFLMRRRGSG